MEKKFLNYVRKVCKEHQIKVELIDSAYFDVNGSPCSGCFDEDGKTLTVCTKKPKKVWVGILAHEFCHFLQSIRQTNAWKGCSYTSLKDCIDSSSLLDLWLNKDIELNDKQLKKCINSVIAVELECEKMAVELIKEFGLDIDVDLYIQQANSYLLFYQAVREFRKWCIEGRPSIKNKKVVAKMRKTFSYRYNYKLRPDLLEDYRWCFFKKTKGKG